MPAGIRRPCPYNARRIEVAHGTTNDFDVKKRPHPSLGAFFWRPKQQHRTGVPQPNHPEPEFGPGIISSSRRRLGGNLSVVKGSVLDSRNGRPPVRPAASCRCELAK
jgi:hypothetical protein